MSMFRKPGESSSESSSSDDEPEVSEYEKSGTSVLDENISRIHTIESRASRSRSGTPPESRPISRNQSNVRDLLLHTLLEEKAKREAAEHLGKNIDDPEVQELGTSTYLALSRQLEGVAGELYDSELMRSQRAAVKEGLKTATRNHLQTLTAGVGGPSGVIATRVPPVSDPRLKSLLNRLTKPLETTIQEGYPGLHTDRYVREFNEIGVVGKGGYGTVYKVKHKLDNSLYAVKRIKVSPARLKKIHENGAQEMEKLLDEVRTLARFDHGNIVRYHNCWLEFTMNGNRTAIDLFRENLLLGTTSEKTRSVQTGLGNLTLGDPAENKHDSIVFEYSGADTGAGPAGAAEESEGGFDFSEGLSPAPRNRSASLATIATQSSVRSHMSTIEDVHDEEEIETIPRAHGPKYDVSSSGVSDSMFSQGDSNQLVPSLVTGPILTLNIQMSLYDTDLSAFLASDQSEDTKLSHCFHHRISLELLDSIVSGVEYLHSQGLVHRDLKPANVFLAVSNSKIAPAGSIDLSRCHACPVREVVHITPRIGDFGLVAALGDEAFKPENAKPVGTEFYRPEMPGGVNEKLDVFALGIMAFEMLEKFSTRMERAHTLYQVRRSEFPSDWVEKMGEKVVEVVKGMVKADEEERLALDGVKPLLGQAIKSVGDEA